MTPTDGTPDLTAGPDWSRALLRWGRHEPDWQGYAVGYRRGAEALVEQVRSARASVDLLVFPLVAVYRHALELHLKWLTVTIREELGTSTRLLMTHDVERLWRHLRDPARALGLCDQNWDELSAGVLTLATLDPKGEAFRYPIDVSGQPSHALETLNVETVARVAANVLDALEALVEAARDEGRMLAEVAMRDAANAWWYSLPDDEREQYEAEDAELHAAYMAGHIP